MNICKIKNISGTIQDILKLWEIDEEYLVPDSLRLDWANSSSLITAIATSILQVGSDTEYFSDIVEQINWLDSNSTKVNREGTPLVDLSLRRGIEGEDGFTIVSPDLTDRTTWYQNSVRLTDETLTDVGDGLNFQAAEGKRHWVNIYSNKLTVDHNKVLLKDGTLGREEDFEVEVKVNSEVVTSGFSIDYVNGKVTFDSSQSGNTVIASFNHNDLEGASNFIIRPTADYKFLVEHVEIQFSKNLNFNNASIIFETWAGDPSYSYYEPYSDEMFHYAWGTHDEVLFRAVDPGLAWTIAAGVNGTYIPFDGTSTIASILSAWNTEYPDLAVICTEDDSQVLAAGGLALVGGFGQMRSNYRSMRDLINWCNNQYPVIPACGDLQNDILCFPFRYLVPAEIKQSDGALARISTKNDLELIGELATVTFYMEKIDL